MYDVARISEDTADKLAAKDLAVFINLKTVEFYTYEEMAEAELDKSDYELIAIDEAANASTWPIRKKRRMFPR